MVPDLGAITDTVFACLTNARQAEPFTTTLPGFDQALAYQVARHVHDRRIANGAIPRGRKIGFTNRTIWEEYGVYAPIWGHVYDTTLADTDAHAHGSLPLAGLCEPRIEPEIVFGLSALIHPAMDDSELVNSLDWIAHGYEIVQSIYPDWQFEIADTIACGGLHGRMIVGPKIPVSNWRSEDLSAALRSFTIDLNCDGKHVDAGTGANVLDSPLNALRHLAGVLADEPGSAPLEAGEIITTGTLTRAFPVAPGQHWTTRLRGLDLPGMDVHFT